MIQRYENKFIRISLLVSVCLFVAGVFGGYVLGFAHNSECLPYLGCNAGFFGYDAVFEHYLAGIAGGFFIIWVSRRFSRFNLFAHDFKKDIVIFIALVMLFGVVWEMAEFTHDHILSRIPIFSEIPILLPHHVFQPTNSDTMGDLTFDFLGGLTAVAALECIRKSFSRAKKV